MNEKWDDARFEELAKQLDHVQFSPGMRLSEQGAFLKMEFEAYHASQMYGLAQRAAEKIAGLLLNPDEPNRAGVIEGIAAIIEQEGRQL